MFSKTSGNYSNRKKKWKDRSYIENWRLISLVKVDTKIISKVIATRIKYVLPIIIHYNQTGYVKDRYIGETIRSVFDVMNFTAKESIPGFDSVEWEFLLYCLKSFKFRPNFKDTAGGPAFSLPFCSYY